MIYINNAKAIRVIAASAEIEAEGILEIRSRDGELIAVYSLESGREYVIIPCEWHVFVYNSGTILRIDFDDVEIRFEV